MSPSPHEILINIIVIHHLHRPIADSVSEPLFLSFGKIVPMEGDKCFSNIDVRTFIRDISPGLEPEFPGSSDGESDNKTSAHEVRPILCPGIPACIPPALQPFAPLLYSRALVIGRFGATGGIVEDQGRIIGLGGSMQVVQHRTGVCCLHVCICELAQGYVGGYWHDKQ